MTTGVAAVYAILRVPLFAKIFWNHITKREFLWFVIFLSAHMRLTFSNTASHGQ